MLRMRVLNSAVNVFVADDDFPLAYVRVDFSLVFPLNGAEH